MRFSRGVEPVYRLGSNCNRSVETKRLFGTWNIIVDCLGHTDNRDQTLRVGSISRS